MTCDYTIHKPDGHRAEIIHIIPPAPHFFLFQYYNGKLRMRKIKSHKGMHRDTFTTLEGSNTGEAH